MVQNDKDACKSVRCCCKLISNSGEKPPVAAVAPKPRNDDCGGRAERPQISLCDFLKSQPIPEWIKVNDMRPQQHQNQQRPSCKPDNSKGSPCPEDMQSSQIIINFGTVVTSGTCKQDSYQQTDPEVQQQQVCPATVSQPAPVDRSNCTCPAPAKRPTPSCPPADRPASSCPAPAIKHPPARNLCSGQEKRPSAVSSSSPKSRAEVTFKCCCNCHSD